MVIWLKGQVAFESIWAILEVSQQANNGSLKEGSALHSQGGKSRSKKKIIWGHIVSIMGYFELQWPVALGCLEADRTEVLRDSCLQVRLSAGVHMIKSPDYGRIAGPY